MSIGLSRVKAAVLAALIAVAALLALTQGCGGSGKEGGEQAFRQAQQDLKEAGESEVRPEERGPVTLKLYFLDDTGGTPFLRAEERTVPYTQAVARAALEELFKGPSAGSGLTAVFPNTVRVLDVSVTDGICTVSVSKEIITDKAASGGAGAMVESLALASIANTLTEFPTVSKVKLLVEGKQSGVVDGRHIEDFWGHVGLPEYLERDMSVVGPR